MQKLNGTPPSPTLHVGVIGCGYWGPNLIRNFAELPGCRVVKVCDLRPELLEPVRARYPAIETCADVAELFRDPRIDAVVIATPVRTHFELAMKALKAGKHVLVEKPITTTAAEAEALIEEAKKRKRVLMVDHTFVYTGAVRKIKELLDSDALGRLYYYDSVRVNLGLFQHDANVLWDLAVHDLGILDYLMPELPRAVAATGLSHLPSGREDIAYLTCLYPNNFIAHFHVNWLAPVKVRRTLIGGARKMVVYDDLEPDEKIHVYDKGFSMNDGSDPTYQQLVSYRTGDMWAPRLDRTEALRVEAAHFVDCAANGKRPLTGGEAGLRVVRILEAAERSLSQGGQPVDLDAARKPRAGKRVKAALS